MNNKKNGLSIYLIAICIVSFISFIPMFVLSRDLWDGVIISHAFESTNREIYWNWFTESGWFLTPLMYDIFFFIFSTDSFLLAIQMTMVFGHIVSTIFVYRLSKVIFKSSEFGSIIGAFIFAFSPIWNIYYSTVFLMHSITLPLALICVERVILCKNKIALVLFFILSFITFQQVSCAVLIMTLLTADVVLNNRAKFERKLLLAYILTGVVFFIISRILFPAHGLYVGYNKIDILNVLNKNIWQVFYGFLTSVYPLILVLIFLFSVENIKNNIKMLFVCIALLFCNIVPYVAVAKPAWYSHLFVVEGWDQRQAIAVITVISLFFSIIFTKLSSSSNFIFRFISLIFLVCTSLYSIYQYYGSMLIKSKSILLQKSIENAIIKHKDEIGDCGIVLKLETPNNYKYFNNYELTYITNKVKGKYWYAKFDWESDPGIFKEHIYRDKYMLPSTKPNCMKTVEVNSYNINLIGGRDLINNAEVIMTSSRVIYEK